MLAMEQIARVCHEANRAYCKALGDDSHQPWDEAPYWQRKSAVAGVRAVVESGGLDAEQKTHPSMRPFAELPESEQRKDKLFLNIVNALAHAMV